MESPGRSYGESGPRKDSIEIGQGILNKEKEPRRIGVNKRLASLRNSQTKVPSEKDSRASARLPPDI